MSATSRPVPRLPRHERPTLAGDPVEAVRRIAILAALALLVSQLMGPFAGIVLFAAGLAMLAAYAATHPHHP